VEHYNVIVIGGGIAGISVAKKCAYGGLKVLLIEERRLGGRSLHGGGTFIHHLFQSIKMIHQMKEANQLAIRCDTSTLEMDFADLLHQYQDKKRRIEISYEQEVSQAMITLIHGKASMWDPHSVKIGEKLYSASSIVLAFGGRLRIPDIDGLKEGKAHGFVLEPTDVENLTKKPSSIAIYGSGRIAYELSQVFLAVGTEVTLIAPSPLIQDFDPDIRSILIDKLQGERFRIIPNAQSIQIGDRSIHIVLDDETIIVKPEYVFIATGYEIDHETLGPVDIAFDDAGIITDDQMRTNMDHIYAIGDCNRHPHLSNIAIEEAEIAGKNVLGIHAKISYDHFINSLMGLFEYAFIGLSEPEANRIKEPHYIASFSLDRERRLYSQLDTPLIKIILSKIREHILGLHIVGEEAVDEITQLYSILNPSPLGGLISVPVHSRFFEIKDYIDVMHHDYHQQLIHHMFSAYQTIVRPRTYETVGYESLSRFLIDGQVYPPLPIIQMLERSGYIRLLDIKSFENAVVTLNQMKQLGYLEDCLHISINVSAHTLTSVPSDQFRMMAEKGGCHPNQITIEVTEREMIDNTKVLEVLNDIKKSGFRLSLDDFSVGHASLILLDRFSFDEVKLDRDLLPKDEYDLNRISSYRHLVDILKQRGVEIVAEGIETAFHKDFVYDLDMDRLQGFFFSVPEKIG
jgi:pyruvate/2-oxoglutarate dehydrogenase complex dihydrolipoamide dehydrogenase (E3) component/EAL domain-containing protein (putative c-di-GMP-specific phosphodiesterase class I)